MHVDPFLFRSRSIELPSTDNRAFQSSNYMAALVPRSGYPLQVLARYPRQRLRNRAVGFPLLSLPQSDWNISPSGVQSIPNNFH